MNDQKPVGLIQEVIPNIRDIWTQYHFQGRYGSGRRLVITGSDYQLTALKIGLLPGELSARVVAYPLFYV